MPSSRPSRRKLDRRGRAATLLGMTLVALILVLGGYYYARTTTNEHSLIQRNLRELGRIGQTVEGRVNNLEKVLGGLVKSCGKPRVETRTPYLSLDCCAELTDTAPQGADPVWRVKLRTSPACDWPWWSARGVQPVGTDQAWLVADRRGLKAAYVQGAEPPEPGEAPPGPLFVSGTWDVEPLRTVLHSDLFDLVLLVRADGRVLLSKPAGSGLQLLELSAKAPGIAAADGETAKVGPQRSIHGSAVERPLIAGVRYRLFVQPVDIQMPLVGPRPVGAGSDGASKEVSKPAGDLQPWAVAGLVSASRFRAEALRFGPPRLLAVILGLVLALLSLPFLRVWLMGPRERVNVSGVLGLIIAYVVLGGLMGLLLADYGYYDDLKEKIYGSVEEPRRGALSRVAEQLEENLATEIAQGLAELDCHTAEFRKRTAGGADAPADQVNLKPCPRNSPYPHAQMVFWVDKDGWQKTKWTSRRRNTARTNVRNRAYFRTLLEHRAWPRPDAPDRQYMLDSIRSWTTGEQQGVLSVGYCWSGDRPLGDCPEAERGIAAMIIPPVSLDRPVLPPGVGFAVIESDGRTLFHSRPERNLDENFVDETDRDPRLRSALLSGVARSFATRYMGQDHWLHVRRLSGAPLHLVVTLDKGYVRTLNLEVLFAGGALLVVYALAVLIIFTLSEWSQSRRLSWAWPNLSERWRHVLQVGILAAFTLELVAQAIWPEALPLHWSTLFVPLQAMALGLVVLTCESQQAEAKARDRPAGLRRFTDGENLGWALLVLATVAMLLGHRRSFFGGLLVLQLLVAGLVAGLVWLYRTSKTAAWRKRASRVEAATWRKLFSRVEAATSRVEAAAEGAFGRWSYIGSLALTPILVGLLPGFLLTQTLFRDHAELFVGFHQLRAAAALEERDRRLYRASQQDRLPPEDLCPAIAGQLDLAFEGFPHAFEGFPHPGLHRLLESDRPAWARCGGLSSPAREWPWRGGSEAEERPRTPNAFHRFLYQRVGEWLPYPTRASVELRRVEGEIEKANWRILRPEASPPADDQRQSVRTALLGRPYRELAAAIPHLRWPGLGPGVVLTLGLLVLVVLARWLARRIFLADLPPPQSPAVQDLSVVSKLESEGPGLLFVCTRGTDRQPVKDNPEIRYVNVFDLAAGRVEAWPGHRSIVCFDFFDHRFHDPEWNERFLNLCERLHYVEGKRLVLLTSCSPENLLPLRPVEGAETGAAALRLQGRWIRLLGRFLTIRLPAADKERLERTGEDARIGDLTMELRAKSFGRKSGGTGGDEGTGKGGAQASGRAEDRRFSDDEIRDRVAGYYRAIWTILGREERLVVAQLAAGAVVNPGNAAAIRRLEARGLVERAPELRLLNERFSSFVREQVPEEGLAAWEREGGFSAWQQLRAPIYLGLAAVALFLLVTQAELFDTATAFVSTVALAGGAALRLATLLRRPGSEAAAE